MSGMAVVYIIICMHVCIYLRIVGIRTCTFMCVRVCACVCGVLVSYICPVMKILSNLYLRESVVVCVTSVKKYRPLLRSFLGALWLSFGIVHLFNPAASTCIVGRDESVSVAVLATALRCFTFVHRPISSASRSSPLINDCASLGQ